MALERDLHLKRVVDVFAAALGLALFSPVLLLSGLLIRLTMSRPVLYVGPRPGLRGRIFRLYKFRTMTDERGPDGRLLPDAKRLTPPGRFLRRLSLDELPQLWNVLKGDMSLVGPRPLLVEYLDRYTPMQARRHEVRPGITGWAQLNGRQNMPFSLRFQFDLWYVENWSLGLDLRILLKTLLAVVKGKDVVLGQNVGEVDDVGLSMGACSHAMRGEAR